MAPPSPSCLPIARRRGLAYYTLPSSSCPRVCLPRKTREPIGSTFEHCCLVVLVVVVVVDGVVVV